MRKLGYSPFVIFNCRCELDAWHTLMVFKSSLCNVICYSVFITMPTGRTLLFPLTGKWKTRTKKKPYLFTSCFHSGGGQEMLWVYYLASCEYRDVRPCYVFVCSGGRAITQNAVPFAVLAQAQKRRPTQPCPYSTWLGNAAGAWLLVSSPLANLSRAGFNSLLSQGFCLFVYAVNHSCFSFWFF